MSTITKKAIAKSAVVNVTPNTTTNTLLLKGRLIFATRHNTPGDFFPTSMSAIVMTSENQGGTNSGTILTKVASAKPDTNEVIPSSLPSAGQSVRAIVTFTLSVSKSGSEIPDIIGEFSDGFLSITLIDTTAGTGAPISSVSLTSASGTVLVIFSPPTSVSFNDGDVVAILGLSPPDYNGSYPISGRVVTSSGLVESFNYQIPTNPTATPAPGTGTAYPAANLIPVQQDVPVDFINDTTSLGGQ